MTRQDQLQKILDQVTDDVSDIHAAVLGSHDGLAMASTIGSTEGSRVAAMAATVHAVGNRATTTTELGTVEETVIRGREVTFVVYEVGSSAVLALMAPGDCNLGMVHLEGRNAVERLAEAIAAPQPTVEAAPKPPPAPPVSQTPAPPSAPAPASAPASASAPAPTTAPASTAPAATSAPRVEIAPAPVASVNGNTRRGSHERDATAESA